MPLSRPAVAVGLAVAVALGSACWGLRAQEDEPNRRRAEGPGPVPEATSALARPAVRPAVQEAMLRPIDLPFGEPTTLDGVAAHLRRALGAQVVLDRAALDRLGLSPEATVQLPLEGVRLKTGLKLLLDQVGLVAHVVPEDNLLVLTDAAGAGDQMAEILYELKSLHRDVHELQDVVDDILDVIDPPDDGPRMRTPTIIEEVPDEPPKEDAQAAPSSRRSG